MATPPRFEVSALTRRLDREGLRRVWREAAAGELGDDLDMSWSGRHLVAFLVGSGLTVGLGVPVLLHTIGARSVVPYLMFGAMAVALLVVGGWLSRDSPRRRVRTIHRLRNFCRENGFAFTAVPDQGRLPGLIFGYGSNRSTWGLCEVPGPGGFDVANYRCATDTGISEQQVDHWGYLVFRLRESLPHSLLTTSRGFGLRTPRQLLPGDLPGAGPRGEFRSEDPADPRLGAVLSPALLAVLTDARPKLHVEIVDDQLFVYAARMFDLTSPRWWRRIERLRAALTPHLASRVPEHRGG